jgi:hypothetical protein
MAIGVSGLEAAEGVPEKNAAQLRFRMLKAQFFRAGSHDDDDVGAWLQLCTMQSKKFTNEPFRPIPLDSAPDLATRRNSEACLAGRARGLEHQEIPARLAAPATLDSKKIPARSDATRPCEPKIRYRRPGFGGVVTVRRLRPLARRLFSTSRPPGVAMRARKP